ncbi:hypothetical protein Tco_1239099, partial [Tanacetum coccineum]
QVVLDALKLTPFYNAFEISADVPEIYMQEFWVTVTRHHSSLWFKLNGKSHTLNVDTFRDMLKICLKLPGQKFKEPPLVEDILSLIRDLGHTDLVFQVENKNSKKNNDMYYLRFTKVIVNYFMTKDQAIPKRNNMFFHYARDDFMFTTIRVISKHKDTQEYGAILPQHLTNQAMLESEAFKTYRAYDTGEKAPKSKAIKKKTGSESSLKTKPSQASKGKRIKTSAKGDKHATTKSKGLTVLSEVASSEAEQMKFATKRSLKEFHISHASGSSDGVDILSKVPGEQQQTGSGTNEGAGDKSEVPDVPEYRSEIEEESWTFSQGEDEEEDKEQDNDDDNDDNDNEDGDQENYSQRTESDDEGDDFVHPNLSTYKADKEEEKAKDDDELTSDQKDQEDEENGELYGDLNLNLDRQDAEMRDAQTNQETKEAHETLTTEPPVIELSELKQTNQFAKDVSSISGIVDKYLASKVKDTVDVVVQLKSNKLREEAQAENQDFLKSLDSNMK